MSIAYLIVMCLDWIKNRTHMCFPFAFRLTIKHECFNAETIGDAYIAVSGGPEGNDPIKGATNIAAFALDAIDAVEKLDFKDKKIKIRIGMTLLFATLLRLTVLFLHTLFSSHNFRLR